MSAGAVAGQLACCCDSTPLPPLNQGSCHLLPGQPLPVGWNCTGQPPITTPSPEAMPFSFTWSPKGSVSIIAGWSGFPATKKLLSPLYPPLLTVTGTIKSQAQSAYPPGCVAPNFWGYDSAPKYSANNPDPGNPCSQWLATNTTLDGSIIYEQLIFGRWEQFTVPTWWSASVALTCRCFSVGGVQFYGAVPTITERTGNSGAYATYWYIDLGGGLTAPCTLGATGSTSWTPLGFPISPLGVVSGGTIVNDGPYATVTFTLGGA